jgi:uncharacterized protein YjbJ (UPF0337 family)
MNQDILQGKWKQIRGEAQSLWGKLTNDDLDRVEGSSEKLAGILQERYGYSKQRAENEVANFMERFDEKVSMTRSEK